MKLNLRNHRTDIVMNQRSLQLKTGRSRGDILQVYNAFHSFTNYLPLCIIYLSFGGGYYTLEIILFTANLPEGIVSGGTKERV